jgi:predicted nucleotidyltransferase component of viral defense system
MMDALRDVLNPWLGKPQWKQTDGRTTFVHRINSEDVPPVRLRLKVEANTREHFSVLGLKEIPFAVDSRWFEGSCSVHTCELDELLGTKLRALYQRKPGRDLFDLAVALKYSAVDPHRVVAAFTEYMRREGESITRAQFEQSFSSNFAITRSARISAICSPCARIPGTLPVRPPSFYRV